MSKLMPNTEPDAEQITQVAVGIIKNKNAEILISKRASHVHQPDLWEFPGGKIEADESIESALKRELYEELGIECLSVEPFSRIDYDYGDKKVCLHTCLIEKFNNKPQGREGQPIQWVKIPDLDKFTFPAANISIINKLQLPEIIQLTGDYDTEDQLLEKTKRCIDAGVKLIQFRAHELDDANYEHHAKALLGLCRQLEVKLVLNRSPAMLEKVKADGLHLTRHMIKLYKKRPCPQDKLLSVSCHNEAELEKAELLNADYCLLSPVKKALSHDAGKEIGIDIFSDLCRKYKVSIYALGGMNEQDIQPIKAAGGIGVAMITANWK